MKDIVSLPQPVHVRHMGDGPRKVLAIHCTLAHGGAWRGLAGQLPEAQFTAFDMLHHGRSPDWDGQGEFQERNLEAAETLLTGPMDVVGHSFGATVALRLAVRHPELVRSLTLAEPVFFKVAELDAPEVLAQHGRDASPFFEAWEQGDFALAARLFNRMWSTDDSPRWPQLPEATRDAMIRSIPVVPACDRPLFEDSAGLLAPGVLDRVTMPVLLLRGDLTHPVIKTINEGLARRLPDARSEVIEGAGHMVPITHPEPVAAHIRALWSRSH
ncbi:alpha/beta fold hydrolase [Lutimaribacter marinistellae]|uniref:Alpha/beta fold hydrolase n=1 Tax=Lutimaribacter marinistellae TaxID=1820329 RepID=A0ABV7TL08_9RHOB